MHCMYIHVYTKDTVFDCQCLMQMKFFTAAVTDNKTHLRCIMVRAIPFKKLFQNNLLTGMKQIWYEERFSSKCRIHLSGRFILKSYSFLDLVQEACLNGIALPTYLLYIYIYLYALSVLVLQVEQQAKKISMHHEIVKKRSTHCTEFYFT